MMSESSDIEASGPKSSVSISELPLDDIVDAFDMLAVWIGELLCC